MAERAASRADAITVPTHAVAAELAEVLPRIDPGVVHVLGAGVARKLLEEPSQSVVDRIAKRLPDEFLLSLATLEPRKGLDVLVTALARIGDQALPLVVVGQPGWGGIDLNVAARAAGLAPDKVLALGRVGDEELGVILRRATALVAPSRAEGFGLPIAEAMAVGTPVICSDAPALVEVSAGAAVVVPREDADALAGAITTLVGDSSARADLGAAGRAAAHRFDWDDVAGRAWALYRTMA